MIPAHIIAQAIVTSEKTVSGASTLEAVVLLGFATAAFVVFLLMIWRD